MKKMISLIAVWLASSPIQAAPTAITNYDQLLSAVSQAHRASAIIHVQKCRVTSSKPGDLLDKADAMTKLNFDVFGHYKVKLDSQHTRDTVATSNTMLLEHSEFGFVYGYARLRVFEDNTAEFHTAFYDPKTYAVKRIVNYECRVGDGVMLFDV